MQLEFFDSRAELPRHGPRPPREAPLAKQSAQGGRFTCNVFTGTCAKNVGGKLGIRYLSKHQLDPKGRDHLSTWMLNSEGSVASFQERRRVSSE